MKKTLFFLIVITVIAISFTSCSFFNHSDKGIHIGFYTVQAGDSPSIETAISKDTSFKIGDSVWARIISTKESDEFDLYAIWVIIPEKETMVIPGQSFRGLRVKVKNHSPQIAQKWKIINKRIEED
jgi:hypothetical protein